MGHRNKNFEINSFLVLTGKEGVDRLLNLPGHNVLNDNVGD